MAPNGDQVSTATVFSAEYFPKVTPKSKEDPTVIQRLLEQNAQDDQVEERRKVTPLKIVLENYKTPNECEGVFTPRIVSMKRKADMCSSMECPHCDKQFPLGGQWKLRRHILHAHKEQTGNEAFRCDICDKTFPSKPVLVSHNEMHRIGSSWDCHICKRRFGEIKLLGEVCVC